MSIAEIDHAALAANAAQVTDLAGAAQVMGVVKADAYGHGMAEVAATLRAAGVPWLGVARPSEALALRESRDTGRILAWLWSPGDPDVARCVAAEIDLSVSSQGSLREVVSAVNATGHTARVHLKVDTGLARNGASPSEWPALAGAAAAAAAAGAIEVSGVWSHLADGDEPGAPSATAQQAVFEEALDVVRAVGLDPGLRHLGNSGTLWAHPGLRYDLVRSGIALYGLTPGVALGSAAGLGLRPVMTLRTTLAHAKDVPAGTQVSYAGTWTAPRSTRLGLVPLGYADGIPRAASGLIDVLVAGARVPQVGRVAMDQCVVDLGALPVHAGADVVVFGPGDSGEPTADEFAARIGTIGYEIVTRIGPRVVRVHRGMGR